MLNDYSRRGAVDGRGLRLPVIAVRPGAPNAATTGAWAAAYAAGQITIFRNIEYFRTCFTKHTRWITIE